MLLRPSDFPAGFIEPCLPSSAPTPPSGELWLHEIKWDGFRVIARKTGPRVKLYSRPGNELTKRFPLIVQAVAKLQAWVRLCDHLKSRDEGTVNDPRLLGVMASYTMLFGALALIFAVLVF